MSKRARSWQRRMLALLTLMAYLAGAIGLPLPAPREPLGEDDEPIAGWSKCGCPIGEQKARTCCCGPTEGGCCSSNVEEPPPPASPTFEWAAGQWQARCQGSVPGWLMLAAPLVLTPSSPVTVDQAPLGWLVPVDARAPRLTLPPDNPPPRALPC